ncbi:unnamed protein product, partial [Mesorhabditis spiculigera]
MGSMARWGLSLCGLASIFVLVQCQEPGFTYLTAQDFFNAQFVNTNTPMRMRPLNDIRLRYRRGLSKRGIAVSLEKDKWPMGRVPYVISSSYTSAQKAVLARSFAAYQQKTCITFVPKRSADKDYVVISKLDGCYADFARVGGRQQVSLADECVDYATVIHELMHVIGFIHEHQREDRDQYVKIVWQNIIPGANGDFDKLTNLGLSYYNEGYDYTSIMHYESNEGSKNGKNTIEAKQQQFTNIMGKATDFSVSDLRRVNRMYGCWSKLG